MPSERRRSSIDQSAFLARAGSVLQDASRRKCKPDCSRRQAGIHAVRREPPWSPRAKLEENARFAKINLQKIIMIDKLIKKF